MPRLLLILALALSLGTSPFLPWAGTFSDSSTTDAGGQWDPDGDELPEAGGKWDPNGGNVTDVGNLWDPNG